MRGAGVSSSLTVAVRYLAGSTSSVVSDPPDISRNHQQQWYERASPLPSRSIPSRRRRRRRAPGGTRRKSARTHPAAAACEHARAPHVPLPPRATAPQEDTTTTGADAVEGPARAGRPRRARHSHPTRRSRAYATRAALHALSRPLHAMSTLTKASLPCALARGDRSERRALASRDLLPRGRAVRRALVPLARAARRDGQHTISSFHSGRGGLDLVFVFVPCQGLRRDTPF